MRIESPRLYLRLASASVRAQMQYRLAFAVRSVADFFVLFADFLPIYILFRRFGGLIRYALSDIERWAAQQSRMSTSEAGHDAT